MIFLAWVVAINAMSTIVVSAVNPWFIGAIIGLGGIAGFRIGVTIGAVEVAKSRHKKTLGPRAARILFAAAGCAFGVVVGNTAAYRLADVILFWRSGEPIVTVAFPIRSVRMTKSSPRLSIGSEGEYDGIGISMRDYDILSAVTPFRRPWQYCVSLKRQASHEAVRIWKPTQVRRSGPQTVFPCPTYAQWW